MSSKIADVKFKDPNSELKDFQMDVLNSNSTNAMKQNETKIDTDIVTETEIENDEYDSDDESEITTNEKGFSRKIFSRIKELFKTKWFKISLMVSLASCYMVYFGFAMWLNNPFNFPQNKNSSEIINQYIFSNNQGLALLFFTIVAILLIFWDCFLVKYKILDILLKNSSKNISNFFEFSKIGKFLKKYGSWVLIFIITCLCIVYLIIDLKELYNLVSLTGIFVFVLVSIFLSSNRHKINWHILISGLLLQFILGVFLTRVEFGYSLFKFVGNQIITFLEYTNKGSELVFGEKYTDHSFSFQSLPIIIFFGSFINLLFYLNIIQYFILKVSWLINSIMGTSPCESINATANIFLGQTEAPLLISKFLPKMTKSEIFSIMTGGFATVAGSVLAAYVAFGVSSNHLIIASLMAAPGALAISKTMFPETKKTKADWNAIRTIPKGEATNLFEAISIGASNMVTPVAGIIANLIAYTAFFTFIDKTFAWFLGMLGLENFGLTSIMQYLFFPFSLFMGINIEDCKSVSKLIGTKIFVNEFIAYSELGRIIKFKENITLSGQFESYYNGTMQVPNDISMIWNDRSVLIATYALCGFANFASVGMVIGGLTALAPSRSKVFARYAAKAMIAGNLTNFISACIAGLLYTKL